MRHKITPRTQEILRELHRLAAEVERHLYLASRAARREWDAFQSQWPSDDELRQETMAVSDDALEAMKAKVRRFRDILRDLPRPLRYGKGAALHQTTDFEHAAAWPLQTMAKAMVMPSSS